MLPGLFEKFPCFCKNGILIEGNIQFLQNLILFIFGF